MDTFLGKKQILDFGTINPCVILGLAALGFRRNALFSWFPPGAVTDRIREAIFIQITVDFFEIPLIEIALALQK